MFLTWIRWSSLVGPRGKDPGPRGRDPGPIGGAPNPWGVPNVSIPREIFTGSPLDRIVEQWCTECWDAFNQGFLFPFPVRRLLFSKFNCQSDLRLFARLCRLGRLKREIYLCTYMLTLCSGLSHYFPDAFSNKYVLPSVTELLKQRSLQHRSIAIALAHRST